MKKQMRFQKYLCLAMIIVGVLALLYAFFYCTGSLAELGQTLDSKGRSLFKASSDKYDATLFTDIQGFNNAMMYCGIVMVLLGVLLYVTSCNSRRNYYISNYVATGICAGGNIVMSVILLIMNGVWMGRFMNVDFEAWNGYWEDERLILGDAVQVHYSESTAWFSVGFVIYALVIVASVILILNLVWKIKLMRGEKKLLVSSPANVGGAV